MIISAIFPSWDELRTPAMAVRLTQPFEYGVQSVSVYVNRSTSSLAVSSLARIAFSLMVWPAMLADSAVQLVVTPIYAGVSEGIYLQEQLQVGWSSAHGFQETSLLLLCNWKPLATSLLRGSATTLACWALIALKINTAVTFLSLEWGPAKFIVHLASTSPSSFFAARTTIRAHWNRARFGYFVLPNLFISMISSGRELVEVFAVRIRQTNLRLDHVDLEELAGDAALGLLERLSQQVMDTTAPDTSFHLEVILTGASEIAQDAGGPARQVVNGLGLAFYRFATQMAEGAPLPDPRPLCLPKATGAMSPGAVFASLNVEEQRHYENFGRLMALCYYSSRGDGYVIGQIFAPQLFKALHCLTREEIDTPFEQLSLGTKAKLCRALFPASHLNDLYEWMERLAVEEAIRKELMADAAQWTAEKMSSLSTGQLLELTGALASYPDDKKESYVERLKAAQLSPDQEAKLRTFVEGWGNELVVEDQEIESLKDMNSRQLLDKAICWLLTPMPNPVAAQLAPIHAMAKGLESVGQHQSVSWRQGAPEEMAYKIQGSLNREALLNALVNQAGIKGEWLIDWLRNQATDKEVESWLTFTTGSSSFTGTYITLELYGDRSLPTSCSCLRTFKIAPVVRGESSNPVDSAVSKQQEYATAFGHENKERFIACVRKAIEEEGFGFV